MHPDVLVGTWRLLRVEAQSSDGQTTHPFGRNPVGSLVYTKEGHVSVMLMSGERACFATGALGAGTQAEKAAAFDSFLAYSGRYELAGDRVVHWPEVSLLPNWVGQREE